MNHLFTRIKHTKHTKHTIYSKDIIKSKNTIRSITYTIVILLTLSFFSFIIPPFHYEDRLAVVAVY